MAGSSANSNVTAVALACTGVAVAGGALLLWQVLIRTKKDEKGGAIEKDDTLKVNLPYFDLLLAQLEAGSGGSDDPQQQHHAEALQLAFGRHVHWGYWSDPTMAVNDSATDFAAAAEALCRLVVDGKSNIDSDNNATDGKNSQNSGPQPGETILDVGCGFGGTIASLNERYKNLTLTGLNIDKRQLDRARRLVQPVNDNGISFVHGNACHLTEMKDATFDMVSAVECVFHFPSRDQFFAEARRVLKSPSQNNTTSVGASGTSTGGRLVLSDFVLADWFHCLLTGGFMFDVVLHDATYGDITVTSSRMYQRLARRHGFSVSTELDITEQTLPTYPFVQHVQRFDPNARSGHRNAATTAKIEWLSRRGWVRYMVYRFDVE